MSLDAAPPPLPLPSASTISATATSGVHVVKLSGYSHAKQLLGTGECVESAVFKAAGHSWRVKVYPNGALENCRPGSIALVLALAGGNSKVDVRANFRFSLVRHGSKLASAPGGGRVANAPVTFDTDGRDWGFKDRALGWKLQHPEYLKDDAILIRCDITVLSPAVQRRDLEAFDLLCHCNDGLCKNLHVQHGDRTNKKALQSHVDMPQEMTPLLPSASTIAVTASTGCHVIKFSCYSQTKLLAGNGKHIKSAEFTEAGHRWLIRCYPDGDCEELAGHVALYLELAGAESKNVHAKFQFSLVPHGQLTSAPHGGWTGRARWTYVSKYKHNCYGFKDFMTREELEKSAEYLKDDCFYIRCDITAMNEPVAKLHDPEAMDLLCHCNDELCKSIHVPGKPRRCLGMKKMLLSCLPIQVKTSQHPVFDVESRL